MALEEEEEAPLEAAVISLRGAKGSSTLLSLLCKTDWIPLIGVELQQQKILCKT